MLVDSTFADGFYDFKSQKFVNIGTRLRVDCVALRYLLDKDDEFGLQFVVSDGTFREVAKTSSPNRRKQLLVILEALKTHFELTQAEYLGEDDLPLLSPGDEGIWHGLYQRGGLNFLPDDGDQQLIVDSMLKRAHVFLTVDYKTIWKHRNRLMKLGVNVKRPWEYLQSFMFPLSAANVGFLGPDDVINRIYAT